MRGQGKGAGEKERKTIKEEKPSSCLCKHYLNPCLFISMGLYGTNVVKLIWKVTKVTAGQRGLGHATLTIKFGKSIHGYSGGACDKL